MSDQPRALELKLEPATIESFAPYGVIPPFEGDGNPTANLVFTRDDGWVNFIGHSLSEIEVRAGRLRCELLNRHDTHTQTLMPMTGDALLVVAPADVDFSAPEHLDAVKAFALPQYACVHLHRGTWHWGPYPVGADELRVFNIQASGWPTDNGVAELTRDHGVVFEVVT
jgi:ureidoglycolate hydrolase